MEGWSVTLGVGIHTAEMLYCINIKRLAVILAMYVRKITVFHKYTGGLNLSCSNIAISIIAVLSVPFWGSVPDKDEYCRLCCRVLTGSGGRRASQSVTKADGT